MQASATTPKSGSNSLPALAVTAFFGFLGGWTEFALSWQFLNNPKDFTLGLMITQILGFLLIGIVAALIVRRQTAPAA